MEQMFPKNLFREVIRKPIFFLAFSFTVLVNAVYYMYSGTKQ
jgi:hypothetical protein